MNMYPAGIQNLLAMQQQLQNLQKSWTSTSSQQAAKPTKTNKTAVDSFSFSGNSSASFLAGDTAAMMGNISSALNTLATSSADYLKQNSAALQPVNLNDNKSVEQKMTQIVGNNKDLKNDKVLKDAMSKLLKEKDPKKQQSLLAQLSQEMTKKKVPDAQLKQFSLLAQIRTASSSQAKSALIQQYYLSSYS
jgi:hypothetical protein